MNILSTLSQRFKVYTYPDRHEIPSSSGTYAWFFPLYAFDDFNEAQQLADLYRHVFALDSSFSGEYQLAEKEYTKGRHTRSWQTVSLKADVTISPTTTLPSNCQRIWEKVQACPESKKVFDQSLMAASLFTPPLYIGKTNDLETRYYQHLSDSGFKKRFEQFCRNYKLPLSISDLIFCSLSLDVESEKLMSDKIVDDSEGRDMNYLLEQILMKSARPPFSRQ